MFLLWIYGECFFPMSFIYKLFDDSLAQTETWNTSILTVHILSFFFLLPLVHPNSWPSPESLLLKSEFTWLKKECCLSLLFSDVSSSFLLHWREWRGRAARRDCGRFVFVGVLMDAAFMFFGTNLKLHLKGFGITAWVQWWRVSHWSESFFSPQLWHPSF